MDEFDLLSEGILGGDGLLGSGSDGGGNPEELQLESAPMQQSACYEPSFTEWNAESTRRLDAQVRVRVCLHIRGGCMMSRKYGD